MKCVYCGKENKDFWGSVLVKSYFCEKCKNKSLVDFRYCYVCGSELMEDTDHPSELWCPSCIIKITTIIK